MLDRQLGLDYIGDDRLTGYRLDRLEVLNWGTFNKDVWTLDLRGRNSLLTGDIGTGKTTLVDAVTTLLVPAHRVAYNKAAGAAFRERTLRSYVLGYYKAERSEVGDSSARPVALRDIGSYSVILGVFKNVGYTKTVTLAQVFWATDNVNQPRRFYVAAERDMSITDDFSQFGTEIAALRRKLRRQHVTVWDTFPPYGAWFRRRFGIHNEQAMDLFHQTVSMKSVGNLTQFVRQHMLEQFDAGSQIDALISHFDDLTHAHEAVLKAKRQIKVLIPLVGECDRYDALASEIDKRERGRGALEPYFAKQRIGLLESRIASESDARQRETARLAECKANRDRLADKRNQLNSAIAESGGDRLSQLDSEIRRQIRERDRRKRKAEYEATLLRKFDEQEPRSREDFLSQRKRLREFAEQLRARRERLGDELVEMRSALREREIRIHDLSAEIESLSSRRSNIPSDRFALRRRLCKAVGVEEGDVPFAGELLSVKPNESQWEGALERLLRDFGLSLLIRDAQYEAVANWVDAKDLNGRLIYFRIRRSHRGRRWSADLHRQSAVRKLLTKSDSPFRDWLERELTRRFDVACCESLEQFRKQPSAITKLGQIKKLGELHEKDDRYRIDDRSRYVLGWSNASKIKALESVRRSINAQVAPLRQDIAKANAEQEILNKKIDALSRLLATTDFIDIDWHTKARMIAELEDEKRKLELTSDILKHLRSQLEKVKRDQITARSDWETISKAIMRLDTNLEDNKKLLDKSLQIISAIDLNALENEFIDLARIQSDRFEVQDLDLRSINSTKKRINDWLEDEIKRLRRVSGKSRDEIIRRMKDYNMEYPLETSEVDASVESGSDYRYMLKQLRDDDLPKFEERFKRLLNENTIREIANFQAQLDRERETIKERIEIINGSLSEISYNPNRYIRLESEQSTDQEIAQFRNQLRRCTEGSLTGSEDDQYSETKFSEVKKIIDRFRGREGTSEQDRRWTAKVTDVRNWFVFGASERWMSDDSEYEHYSDSAGKSGGQKEKLAYTILAASLTYQFGLDWGAARSRSFRFVVIDEAFGRGSDESADFALRLFDKLNLQLLIVTPLQKIYVIEPFVESVGFVEIRDDRDSRLCNLSIQQYRSEKHKATGRARPRSQVQGG